MASGPKGDAGRQVHHGDAEAVGQRDHHQSDDRTDQSGRGRDPAQPAHADQRRDQLRCKRERKRAERHGGRRSARREEDAGQHQHADADAAEQDRGGASRPGMKSGTKISYTSPRAAVTTLVAASAWKPAVNQIDRRHEPGGIRAQFGEQLHDRGVGKRSHPIGADHHQAEDTKSAKESCKNPGLAGRDTAVVARR